MSELVHKLSDGKEYEKEGDSVAYFQRTWEVSSMHVQVFLRFSLQMTCATLVKQNIPENVCMRRNDLVWLITDAIK